MPLLATKQVATRLGVCDKTALRLFKSGEIRAHQVGPRLWRVSEADYERYIDGQVRIYNQFRARRKEK